MAGHCSIFTRTSLRLSVNEKHLIRFQISSVQCGLGVRCKHSFIVCIVTGDIPSFILGMSYVSYKFTPPDQTISLAVLVFKITNNYSHDAV